MGKGVALEFRRRFPEMFNIYRKVCEDRKLHPGQICPYRARQPWILNLAVKDHWRYPSRLEWVEQCLMRFVGHHRRLGITSVAFPWIGAMNGGLPWEEVHDLMRNYLDLLQDIDIEIIEFDPDTPDPLFVRLQQLAQTQNASVFARQVGIAQRPADLICRATNEAKVPSLTRLCELPGLDKATVERLYAHFR